MAQDLGFDVTAGPTVTLTSEDTADGSATTLSGSVNLGNPFPPEIGYEWILTMLSGTVTGYVELRAYWSQDGTDFSDQGSGETVAVNNNLTAAADNKKCGSFPARGQYVKFDFLNESGGAQIDGTSSNTALVLTDLFGDQV